ncbi:hypothetical protein QE320_gp059 [Pseudomonas phage EM]|uniref:Uncharacterized protein n=1 Tax=Pseudomonas phage EM TaxID=2936914 RepID=A0AAE9HGA0_9CAUD|nr:hypothetical protein QE320_gp004 [Pseudomonas phage EM]YP_010761782.1 hypothetical protein QE320_gp059 [Pseudomonas phage EM]UPW35806.1 hypothetical protein EM_004 [Pseudomonas phage EM]UPW35995.1 hypothetical protein EM_210 [Pseudomonas phage EM]
MGGRGLSSLAVANRCKTNANGLSPCRVKPFHKLACNMHVLSLSTER